MTSIEDDDIHNKIIAEILKACTDGCTEQNIIEQTHFSHDQLRRIMAEIVDRELLHYIYRPVVFSDQVGAFSRIICSVDLPKLMSSLINMEMSS